MDPLTQARGNVAWLARHFTRNPRAASRESFSRMDHTAITKPVFPGNPRQPLHRRLRHDRGSTFWSSQPWRKWNFVSCPTPRRGELGVGTCAPAHLGARRWWRLLTSCLVYFEHVYMGFNVSSALPDRAVYLEWDCRCARYLGEIARARPAEHHELFQVSTLYFEARPSNMTQFLLMADVYARERIPSRHCAFSLCRGGSWVLFQFHGHALQLACKSFITGSSDASHSLLRASSDAVAAAEMSGR